MGMNEGGAVVDSFLDKLTTLCIRVDCGRDCKTAVFTPLLVRIMSLGLLNCVD